MDRRTNRLLKFTKCITRASSWLILALLLSCSSPQPQKLVNAIKSNSNCPLDSAQVRSVFNHMQYFPNGTEISLALLVGDSTTFGGFRRHNDSLSFVDNRDGVFEIGSVTKTVTATILAKLAYEGAVDLNAPIKTFLPITLRQSSLNGSEVTLLHLANHTSGLPKEPDNMGTDLTIPRSPYSTYDTARLYEYLTGRMRLHSTPGEQRSYSNLGGGLLGHILTLITRKSYEELLLESIRLPLGMHNTFVVVDSMRARRIVPGRDPRGKVVPNWELNVLAGGGGIKSTAEDMAKYLLAHLTDTTYFLMTQQSTFRYTEHNAAGLGWTWYEDGDRKYVSATGGTGGYSCCVIFERSTRTAIVLLTNVSAFLASKDERITTLCRELSDAHPAFGSARR